jgi:hypothetical protein
VAWSRTQLGPPDSPPEVKLPVGFTTYPGEIWRTPRSWAEKACPSLTYFNELDKGGHFAAGGRTRAVRERDPSDFQVSALTRAWSHFEHAGRVPPCGEARPAVSLWLVIP